MTSPVQPDDAAPQSSPRHRRRIVVGVVVGVVVAAVVAAVAVAAQGSGGNDRAAGAATSAAVAPGGTGAAGRTSSGPAAPSVTAPTTSGTAPGATTGATSVAPARAAMPDLIGKNAAAARIELEGLGFRDVRFGSQDPADPDVVLPQNWTVTRQSAAAGAQVPTDAAIVLTCTRRV